MAEKLKNEVTKMAKVTQNWKIHPKIKSTEIKLTSK